MSGEMGYPADDDRGESFDHGFAYDDALPTMPGSPRAWAEVQRERQARRRLSAAGLREAAAQLLVHAAELDRRPKEARALMEGGMGLVVFVKIHEGGGQAYSYAAIKPLGAPGWYLTGERGPRRALGWGQVLDFIYDRAESVTMWRPSAGMIREAGPE